MRFRKEDGFWLLNIRWANTIEITNDEADFFVNKQEKNTGFNYNDFKKVGSLDRLASFVCKEALVSEEIEINVRKTGVNIDPAKLPNLDTQSFRQSHPNIK